MSTADLSELICPECDRPCDDHASDCPMPDGERVTTGSEPRRVEHWFSTKDGHRYSGMSKPNSNQIADGEWEGPVEFVEVVEPGHDEQTEAALNRLDARIERANAVWQPDPRTVAVVVEALRSPEADEAVFRAQQHPQYMAAGEEGYIDEKFALADFIEERFKPSAPGGDDGH